MVHDIVNDDSQVGLLQTTDNQFHKIVEYNMGSYPNSVATFIARAAAYNSNNDDCAAFEVTFAAKCDSTAAGMFGISSLPTLGILQRDLSLALTNVDIVFNGTKVELHVKGKANTTLNWMGSLVATLFYQPI